MINGFTHYTTRMLRNSAMPGPLTPKHKDLSSLAGERLSSSVRYTPSTRAKLETPAELRPCFGGRLPLHSAVSGHSALPRSLATRRARALKPTRTHCLSRISTSERCDGHRRCRDHRPEGRRYPAQCSPRALRLCGAPDTALRTHAASAPRRAASPASDAQPESQPTPAPTPPPAS
eukprot:scaffold94110_cov60-Phaeocystis_antarctica.AAC.3